MKTLSRRLAAEALGTGLLLATIIGSGIMAQRLAGGNAALALLCNTIPTGAILVVLINVLAPISGAHFNPIVSLVFYFRHLLTVRQLGLYVAVQLIGAVLGVLIAHVMFELPVVQFSTTARAGVGQWLAEVVAAFGLIVVIIGSGRETVAASVGLYITAAYWFTASTSFANPAVTLARSLSDTFAGIAPAHAPAFIAAQLFGALLAMFFASWLWKAKRKSSPRL